MSPEDLAELKPRSYRRWVAIICVLVAIVAVTWILVVATGESDEAVRAKPGAAPSGEVFMRVEAGRGSGPEVEAAFADQLPQALPGTTIHVATVFSQFGPTQLLTWQEVLRPPAPAVAMTCFGHFNRSGGGSGCGHQPGEPSLGWGQQNQPAGAWLNNVNVGDAPPGTAWLVVHTTSDVRIVAKVFGGMAYAEWQNSMGSWKTVTLLDQELNSLWSMDQPA